MLFLGAPRDESRYLTPLGKVAVKTAEAYRKKLPLSPPVGGSLRFTCATLFCVVFDSPLEGSSGESNPYANGCPRILRERLYSAILAFYRALRHNPHRCYLTRCFPVADRNRRRLCNGTSAPTPLFLHSADADVSPSPTTFADDRPRVFFRRGELSATGGRAMFPRRGELSATGRRAMFPRRGELSATGRRAMFPRRKQPLTTG